MVLNEKMNNDLNQIKNGDKLICAICGAAHITTSCDYTNVTSHISNRATSTKARSSLPDDFMVYTLSDGRFKVITNKFIQKGTRFGPLEAAKTFTLNPAIQFPLKIFPSGEDDFLEYYLDTADEETSTWMIFIEPAETVEEQNLMCYQEEQYIYYISVKDINENESLKVWYSPYYAKKMGKMLLQEESIEKKAPDLCFSVLNELVKSQQNIPDIDSWTCKFCNSNIMEVTKFADHLIKEHYRAQISKLCEICKANSKTKKCVCKHVKVVENPSSKMNLAMNVAIEAVFDQNSSRDISIGDPMLNSIRSMDNSDLIIPTSSQTNEDFQIMGVENLNTENLLMHDNFEELDYFDFEIEETKGGVNCDICFKSFSKLPYLIQHLKSHRGDYFCSSCNKIFGRKENLTHHSCNATSIYKCSPCDRTFTQKKYYRRHVEAVHNHKNKCGHCNKIYTSAYELKRHNCKEKSEQRQFYVCEFCKKMFGCHRSLKRHVSRKHANDRFFVCEFCSKRYTTKYSYELHVKTHENPRFKCEECQREFHRKDVLREHVDTVHGHQQLTCDTCNKQFRSKKNLKRHMEIHANLKYKCDACSSCFNSRSNLTRHWKIHDKKDNVESLPHKCDICGKLMKLRSSLTRHVQKKHRETGEEKKEDVLQLLSDGLDLMTDSRDNIDMDMDEMGRKHIQVIDNILLKKSEEMGLGFNNYTLNSNAKSVKTNETGHVQVIDNILLKKSEELGLGVHDYTLSLNGADKEISEEKIDKVATSCAGEVEERQVFLSIPDLMDIGNDIILGDDNFIVHSEIVPSLESDSL